MEAIRLPNLVFSSQNAQLVCYVDVLRAVTHCMDNAISEPVIKTNYVVLCITIYYVLRKIPFSMKKCSRNTKDKTRSTRLQQVDAATTVTEFSSTVNNKLPLLIFN